MNIVDSHVHLSLPAIWFDLPSALKTELFLKGRGI